MILSLAVLIILNATPDRSEQIPSLKTVGLRMHRQRLLDFASGATTKRVHVTIQSEDKDVELTRLVSVASGFVGGYAATVIQTERICRIPCDETITVSPVMDFFIVGNGMGSDALNLAGLGSSVILKVKAGSRGRRIGGIVSLGVGIGGVVLGGTTLLLSGINSNSNSGTAWSAVFSVPAGIVELAVGAVGLVLGIILLRGSGTDVEMLPGTVEPGAAPDAPQNARTTTDI